MKPFEIKNMIIDDGLYTQETITVDFEHDNKLYSVTFNKGDLELINAWNFQGESSIPANLSDELIETIREDIKHQI